MDVLAPYVRFEPFPGGGGLPQLLAPLRTGGFALYERALPGVKLDVINGVLKRSELPISYELPIQASCAALHHDKLVLPAGVINKATDNVSPLGSKPRACATSA